MPTYTYVCEDCGGQIDMIRPMDKRHNYPKCGHCGGPMGLQINSLEWRRGPQWQARSVHGHGGDKPGTKMDDPR